MTKSAVDGHLPNAYEPISCDLFDYIEMACVFQYTLQLTHRDGSTTMGNARNTRVVKGEGEFLQLSINEKLTDIRLDSLASIEPQDSGARFGRISFASR